MEEWWSWCSRPSKKACAQASNFPVSVDDAQPPRRSEVTYKILSTYLPTYLHPFYSSDGTICQPDEVSQICRRLGMNKRVTQCIKYLNQSVFRLSYYSHTWYNDRRLSRGDRERGRSSAFSGFQCKCSSSFHSSTDMRLIEQSIQSIWQHSSEDSTCDLMTSRRLSNVPWQFSSPAYRPSYWGWGARTQTNNLSIQDAHRNSTH